MLIYRIGLFGMCTWYKNLKVKGGSNAKSILPRDYVYSVNRSELFGVQAATPLGTARAEVFGLSVAREKAVAVLKGKSAGTENNVFLE